MIDDETFVYVPGDSGLEFVMNQDMVFGIEGTKEQFRGLYNILKEWFE